ncbi:hypothetical protein predicted by Glimmer/Critica [Ruminococcus bicirculans (ex Wegman et al. 2014)]|uniref:Uncharacterized protein n=1 Tax=Ruminococcus bicirculans (ex Wegman et al. 2014) TaxID=1160721 RepID=A0ABM9QFG8_9FIRM|nr:hypothetical protein predicted by Glimmer/Critica [Ruminococcus bicirculans (ex Wegman et al. 2014)]
MFLSSTVAKAKHTTILLKELKHKRLHNFTSFYDYCDIHTIIISYHINIYKGKAMVRIMVFLGTKKAVPVSALP